MERKPVPKHWQTFEHFIFKPIEASYLVTDDLIPSEPTFERCKTLMGEPICSCGLYILEWEIAKQFGQSQGSDGSNK